MSAITQELFTRPEEVCELFLSDLRTNASLLGIEYVGAYGEVLIPAYPAVVLVAGDTDKELHGTHTYLVTFHVFFHVYHASMSLTHANRNLEDLKLATGLIEFLERDPTLGGNIIFGYVVSEVPSASQVGANKSDVVVSTRLGWEGT